MTLDELMKVHPPGTKFTDMNVWGPYAYFECWFKANGEWHGKKQTGFKMSFSGDVDGWSLWQEPKKKVKRWLFAAHELASIQRGEGWVCHGMYSDAEAEKYLAGKRYVKIEQVMIEVDE